MATVQVVDGKIVVVFTQEELGMEVELRGPVQNKTFYTKREIAHGGGFPCQVVPACDKRLQTLAGASRHNPDPGEKGHFPGNEAE